MEVSGGEGEIAHIEKNEHGSMTSKGKWTSCILNIWGL